MPVKLKYLLHTVLHYRSICSTENKAIHVKFKIEANCNCSCVSATVGASHVFLFCLLFKIISGNFDLFPVQVRAVQQHLLVCSRCKCSGRTLQHVLCAAFKVLL